MANAGVARAATWLFLDLKSDAEGRVFKLAAIGVDKRLSISGADCVGRGRSALDEMADGATGVAGHKMVNYALRGVRGMAMACRTVMAGVGWGSVNRGCRWLRR